MKKFHFPHLANMYYAGPREAVHMPSCEKVLDLIFTVGRDHAGARGGYAPDAAMKLIKSRTPELGINVLCHQGAIFASNVTLYYSEVSVSILKKYN